MEINNTNYKFVSLFIQHDGVTPALVDIIFTTKCGETRDNYKVQLFRQEAIEFFASRPTPRNLYEKLCDDLGVDYSLIPENI